jgi:FlaA1/EpsC-like NDP-sugar epimerase
MIRAYAERGVNGCTVRFGNVLGSNGSVITVFQEQIRQGGPLTITSPCMERFFMTIHEATSLVLQAGSFGRDGNIYVLDMGRPIRIKELAENLIVLSGLTPGSDIAINYIGLREGEKLSETLFWEDAQVFESEHSGIFIEKSAVDGSALLDKVQRLSNSIYLLNADQLSGAVDDTLALRGDGPAGLGRALSGVAMSAAD